MKYAYDVVFSDRKSIAVSVSSDNKITVRCPRGVSRARIDKFVNEKSGWIEKICAANLSKRDANDDILCYKSILLFGERVPLTVGAATNRLDSGGVFVKDIKDVHKLLLKRFSVGFTERVARFSAVTGLTPLGVSYKNYKSRWGCCDGKNRLCFNSKLLMLPPDIQDYVIIHELCHIRYHNHSRYFWGAVSSFLPDYRALRKRLQNYDFIITLY